MSEEKKNVAPTFDAVLKSATDYRNEVRRAMRASEALHFVMAVKTWCELCCLRGDIWFLTKWRVDDAA